MSKNFLPVTLTIGVWLIVVYNNAREWGVGRMLARNISL